jgi:transposase InsO family protein
VDHHIYAEPQEVLMPHRNAPLAETGRLRLARCVVEEGWPLRRAAERFQVSPTTAARWAARYRDSGAAGMADRPSRPHTSPRQTPVAAERRIVKLRVAKRLGPARIAFRLGLNPSTGHKALARCHCPPLAHLDRASGRRVRRYERATPGELVHVDIKKLGNVPDGGGWRIAGRAQGKRNRAATPGHRRDRYRNARLGYAYIHTAIDDHSRLAYSEIHADETKETATAFWDRAHAWFSAAGITIERVMTDNGSCYRSRAWRDALTATGTTHKRIRPSRPQTNGKAERFNRTLLSEWAYARAYRSEAERRATFDIWLHTYNHHRGHTALGGLPPASRVTNLSGQNI